MLTTVTTAFRFLLLSGAATTTLLLGQASRVINVNEPRPLWKALDELEVIVGSTINYEDPPYQNMADCQDSATPEQRATQPAGWKLIVPRDGHVTATIQLPAGGIASQSDVVLGVNLLLANYREQNLPGDFKVEQANGVVYVTPTRVLGANGAVQSVTSPLMTPVTIPNAQRTFVDTTQAILNAVQKATGFRIVTGKFPYWPIQTVTFGADEEPARDALARLFAMSAAAPLSYRLVFEPTTDPVRDTDYVLNVNRTAYVAPMDPPVSTPTIMTQPIPAWQRPEGGPFITKKPPQ